MRVQVSSYTAVTGAFVNDCSKSRANNRANKNLSIKSLNPVSKQTNAQEKQQVPIDTGAYGVGAQFVAGAISTFT